MAGPYVPKIIPETDLEYFRRAGFGVDRGFGTKPAVIVVDMAKSYVEETHPLGCRKTGLPACASIRKLLDKARARSIPIFYTTIPVERKPIDHGVGHLTSLVETEEDVEIVSDLKPRDDDVVITKCKPSAFFSTHLTAYLIQLGVDTVIVTGMLTSGCVRATAVDAFSYNYRVIIPMECVADRSQISHEVSLFDLSMKYADVMPLQDVLSALDKMDLAEIADRKKILLGQIRSVH